MSGAGKSIFEQAASRLNGRTPHAEITGVKPLNTKPKMMSAGLNQKIGNDTSNTEDELLKQNVEGEDNPQASSVDSDIEGKSEGQNNQNQVQIEEQEQAQNSNQELIIPQRRVTRNIFQSDNEKENDTKGMSFQVDLELIPIIKKYTKWGKGYKMINLMLISSLLDNEEVVEHLINNDIVTYNTLIRLEEKYHKKLEEY